METAPSFLREALERLPGYEGLHDIWRAIPQARLVGGCVRDLLRGVDVHDLDIASPLPPEEAQKILESIGAKVVPTGLEHGTVTAVFRHQPYEITTLRRDMETDGRRAIVAWTDDWEEDAARRDFTINAMSLAQDGTLYDYFGGKADLEAGIVRFVGNAVHRVEEDALRALRFFRFHARYGHDAVDAPSFAAIRQCHHLVVHLSAERIASELLKILSGPHVGRTVQLMHEAQVLADVMPQMTTKALNALLSTGHPAEALPRLFALSGDDSTIGARLKLSNAAKSTLHKFSRNAPLITLESSDDDLRRARAEQEVSILLSRSWLRQAKTIARPDPRWDEWRQRLIALPQPVFPLSGRDALSEGIPPGPNLGRLLKKTQEWWMAQGCRPDYMACRTWLAETASRDP